VRRAIAVEIADATFHLGDSDGQPIVRHGPSSRRGRDRASPGGSTGSAPQSRGGMDQPQRSVA
jgi:hypothetical protein